MSASKDVKLAAGGRRSFILKVTDQVRRSLIVMVTLGLVGCSGLAERRFPPPEPAAPLPPPERAPPPAVASAPPPAVEEETSNPRPAGTPSIDGESPSGAQTNRPPSGPYKLDLLPLISFDRPPKNTGKTRIVPGSYVRLVVDGDEQAYEAGGSNVREPVERRRYANEHRSWLKRWAVGLSNSKVLTLQVTLSNPAVTISVPLASASFSSNRKDGESWSTELNPKRSLTPYFKVSPTATLSLKANLQATSKIEGSVTANVISALQKAAELIAPQARLITELNSDRINAASNYIDQSISALFGESIVERSTLDFGPAEWSTEGIVTLNASFPGGAAVYGDSIVEVGTWTVRAEDPIASVFVHSPLCESGDCNLEKAARSAFREMSPYAVLNFEMGEKLTLIEYLRSREGFTQEVASLNALASEKSRQLEARQSAGRLCAMVSLEADRQGLNVVDGAAVVWAVSRSGLFNAQASDLLLSESNSCDAAALWKRLSSGRRTQGD